MKETCDHHGNCPTPLQLAVSQKRWLEQENERLTLLLTQAGLDPTAQPKAVKK